jgi:hypothetical protein
MRVYMLFDRARLSARPMGWPPAARTDCSGPHSRRRTIALEGGWYDFDVNPTYDSVRGTAKFQQLKREWNQRFDRERALLATYRTQQLVPDRDASTGTDRRAP